MPLLRQQFCFSKPQANDNARTTTKGKKYMSEYKDFLTHFKGKMNSQQPEAAKEDIPRNEGVQKNIKATPLLQTSGNSQLHIPDAPEEQKAEENNTRFIKTRNNLRVHQLINS